MATLQRCHFLLVKSPEILGDLTDFSINSFQSRPKRGDIQSRRKKELATLPDIILKSPISYEFFENLIISNVMLSFQLTFFSFQD